MSRLRNALRQPALEVPWRFASSLTAALLNRDSFADVATYCQFVGYPRSGHTLAYALLNAHSEIVLSNELGALRWVQLGFGRRQIFSMIRCSDRAFTARGSRFQGYDYRVPNQWQGRYRKLRVIGDKDGGRDTSRLGRNPQLLEQLRRKVGVPVRLIHVVRNPYDMLTTVVQRRTERGEATNLEELVDRSRQTLATIQRILQAGGDAVLTVRHETIVRDPQSALRQLCKHLGVQGEEDYLRDCASIVFPTTRKTRLTGAWTPQLVQRVQREIIDQVDFLEGYSYES